MHIYYYSLFAAATRLFVCLFYRFVVFQVMRKGWLQNNPFHNSNFGIFWSYWSACNDCKMCYLGNTQQKIKLRINQHLGEVCKLVNTGKTSDSFAKHFALHHKNRESKLTIGEARKRVSVSILWQGNPISCNKSFGKLNCSLCMKERILILKYSRENPNLIINSNSEFYGACRHKPKFHRYAQTTPLPVLMTNNSSERVYLTPNIPQIPNIIHIDITKFTCWLIVAYLKMVNHRN